jgi:hypothetical protein
MSRWTAIQLYAGTAYNALVKLIFRLVSGLDKSPRKKSTRLAPAAPQQQ